MNVLYTTKVIFKQSSSNVTVVIALKFRPKLLGYPSDSAFVL